MGSIDRRREGLKTHWRNLSARARLGESFGFITALSVIYKAGHITKQLAIELLAHHVTAEELKEYRRVHQLDPLT